MKTRQAGEQSRPKPTKAKHVGGGKKNGQRFRQAIRKGLGKGRRGEPPKIIRQTTRKESERVRRADQSRAQPSEARHVGETWICFLQI